MALAETSSFFYNLMFTLRWLIQQCLLVQLMWLPVTPFKNPLYKFVYNPTFYGVCHRTNSLFTKLQPITSLWIYSWLAKTSHLPPFFFFFLILWNYLWLAETSQQPISQTTKIVTIESIPFSQNFNHLPLCFYSWLAKTSHMPIRWTTVCPRLWMTWSYKR